MRLAGEQWESEFKTLIAIILSARSLDETTIKYAQILFEKYSDALSLAKADISEVEKIIKPINFYRNKARNIVKCAKSIMLDYDGKIPMNFDCLVKLSGVGRKTANVFLSEYGKDEIGIDTHVDYISHYLGWTKSKKQEDIEKDLKKIFPRQYWKKINPTLVKFGKKYTSRKEKDQILEKIKSID